MDVFRPTFHMIKSTYLYECSSLKTRERLAGALSTSEPNHSALCVCVCVCVPFCVGSYYLSAVAEPKVLTSVHSMVMVRRLQEQGLR
jgi:hypothetical protein